MEDKQDQNEVSERFLRFASQPRIPLWRGLKPPTPLSPAQIQAIHDRYAALFKEPRLGFYEAQPSERGS